MPRRGLLLDRDGVINLDHGYVRRREDFTFTPGVFPFLRWAQDQGLRLALVTNQSGVARGLYSEADYTTLTAWMRECLEREGIAFDVVLACFAYSEATDPRYKWASFWRKPNPGMLMEALMLLSLDPGASAMIGDKISDMQAAHAACIRTRIFFGSKVPSDGSFQAHTFSEAKSILEKELQLSG